MLTGPERLGRHRILMMFILLQVIRTSHLQHGWDMKLMIRLIIIDKANGIVLSGLNSSMRQVISRPELVAPDHAFQQPEGIVQRSYCAISGNYLVIYVNVLVLSKRIFLTQNSFRLNEIIV